MENVGNKNLFVSFGMQTKMTSVQLSFTQKGLGFRLGLRLRLNIKYRVVMGLTFKIFAAQRFDQFALISTTCFSFFFFALSK